MKTRLGGKCAEFRSGELDYRPLAGSPITSAVVFNGTRMTADLKISWPDVKEH